MGREGNARAVEVYFSEDQCRIEDKNVQQDLEPSTTKTIWKGPHPDGLFLMFECLLAPFVFHYYRKLISVRLSLLTKHDNNNIFIIGSVVN